MFIQCAEEFADILGGKFPNLIAAKRHFIMKLPSPANVQRDLD